MITEEDFLKQALLEARKWEYHQGKLVNLESASARHQHIQQNLEKLLLKTQKDEVPLLLFVPLADVYAYPDVMLAGPTPIIYEEPSQATALLNPTTIIEIYSTNTKVMDSQQKWAFYQNIISLQQYVMIDEQRPLLQMFTKHEQGWKLEVIKDLEKVAIIDEKKITLGEVYEGI
ncbi:MAG TPA: hypothetical protein DCS93_27185 [Microscillaceae bacterium]|nr:hypothetical protein [Microscillaceae bacterium]